MSKALPVDPERSPDSEEGSSYARSTADAVAQDTLLAAERALHAAQVASDDAVLDRLIDDDVLHVGPDGSLATKDDDLEAIRSGRQVLTRADERELRARVVGTTGLTWSLLDIEGSVGGQAVVATLRHTRAWIAPFPGRRPHRTARPRDPAAPLQPELRGGSTAARRFVRTAPAVRTTASEISYSCRRPTRGTRRMRWRDRRDLDLTGWF